MASFVFSIIALTITLAFVRVLNLERRAFSAQIVQENSLYVLELMAREIRVADIQSSDSNCSLTSLAMNHPVNGIVSYNLNNGIVQRIENGIATELSSAEVNFSRLNFCVNGAAGGDRKPTRVTILASVQNRTGKESVTFDLQTTITSRDVQSEF